MTRGSDFLNKAKCSHGHCSQMSNGAWTDLNKSNTILKLHDKCPKCNCQKHDNF